MGGTIWGEKKKQIEAQLKEQLDSKHKYNPIIISGIPFTNNGVIDMLNLTEFYDEEIIPKKGNMPGDNKKIKSESVFN